MLDFALLAHDCAPQVHPNTLAHVVAVESGYNPYAIGVVGARLERQPQNIEEAKATASLLERRGYNFSVGLGQINKTNFKKFGLTIETAFDACLNIAAAAAILHGCYLKALRSRSNEQVALQDAFSCYYSGNFKTGYREGYVARVINSARNERRPGSSKRRLSPARASTTTDNRFQDQNTALLF